MTALMAVINEIQSGCDYSHVHYESEDNHAWYFEGLDVLAEDPNFQEIKVRKADGWIWWKEKGREDWNWCGEVQSTLLKELL